MNIGIGADIAMLVISDIGKLCAGKLMFLNWIYVHLLVSALLVCFIADISVIRISVNLLIGTPLVNNHEFLK